MGLKEKYADCFRKFIMSFPKDYKLYPESILDIPNVNIMYRDLTKFDKRSIIHHSLIEMEKDGVARREYEKVEPYLYRLVCKRI